MSNPSESGIFPMFFIKAVQNHMKSEEEGRPVFSDVEYVKILIAGDKSSEVVRKVRDDDRARWPEIYNAFKNQQTQAVDGLPVEQWPVLSASRVAELKAAHIFTVEALAELPDSRLHVLGMDGRKLQSQAKTFLEAAKGKVVENKLAAENAQLRTRLELLEEQIKALGEKPRQRRRKKVGDAEEEAA